MLYQAKQFIKFHRKASNQHGVHSPFVYELVTQCFYDQTPKDYYTEIANYRKALLKNHEVITITDFGAGSRVFKSNFRKISAIAQHAGATKKRSQLLARLTNHFQPQAILELGTSLGIATMALSSNPSSKVTSLEGCEQTAAVALEQLATYDRNNVKLITGRFRESLAHLLPRTYDLIYFDGNHQKVPTLSYFEQCLKTVNERSVFIFDDIHWTTEMEAAWKHIRNHKKVSLSVDTYKWGLVFFIKGRVKEHFTLRI